MSLTPEDEIYVTLPSNVSSSIFPDNKPSNYKTQLNVPLELPGEWEVALVDIQYPHSWPNFKQDCDVHFTIYGQNLNWTEAELEVVQKAAYVPDAVSLRALCDHICAAFPDGRQPVMLHLHIPSGFFENSDSLATEVVKWFNETEQNTTGVKMKYSYDSLAHLVKLSSENGTIEILMESPYFMDRLGFPYLDRTTLENFVTYKYALLGKDIYSSTEKPYLEDVSALYVYTDIVKYQMVGNTQAPLMGVFPVQGEHGKQLYWNFNPPYYLPVTKTFIPDVQIQLATETGSEIPFREGDVVCRLHFRRKQFSHTI